MEATKPEKSKTVELIENVRLWYAAGKGKVDPLLLGPLTPTQRVVADAEIKRLKKVDKATNGRGITEKHWTDKKKLTITKLDKEGKEYDTEVTVKEFVAMYNAQNKVFTIINIISQEILGQLYYENPENDFFKDCDKKMKDFAIIRAKAIADEKKKKAENTEQTNEKPDIK